MPKRGSAREAVVEAALRLFSRDSYSRVSVEEVASEAGVSKGAVFHYFKSKLELAEEALKLLLARLVTTPFRRIVNSEASVEEKVRALLDLSLEVSSKYNARRLSFLIEVFRELERAGRGPPSGRCTGALWRTSLGSWRRLGFQTRGPGQSSCWRSWTGWGSRSRYWGTSSPPTCSGRSGKRPRR